MGLLLFKQVFAYQTAREAAAATALLTSLNAPTLPVESIATRGALTDALVLFPQFDVRPVDHVLLRAGVMLAWAPAAVFDPIATAQRRSAGTYENIVVNFNGGAPGNYYGTELDGRVPVALPRALRVRPRGRGALPRLGAARRGRPCRRQLPGPGSNDVLLLTHARPPPSRPCAVAVALAASCQSYVAPPVATIDGLADGLLTDPGAPLVIDFSKPIDPATLSVKVIRFDPDADGKLPDETGDPTVSLNPIFSYDPLDGDSGGTSSLDPTNTVYTITPLARLPVGPKLAVLIEPGLSDATHDSTATTAVRKRLLFSYSFTCSGAGSKVLPSGAYFFLLDVEQPIGTQIKVFADLDVDAATGRFVGQFTFASRITDPNRCTPPCANGQVCQTLPGPPACVVPSTRAGTPAEWPDFYANSTPPVGFSFTVNGCAEDEVDGTATFATEPANMVVQQPPVSVDGLVVIASFTPDAAGNVTASGGVTGDDIVFGTSHLGAGHGTVAAQSIPASQAPSIPTPPASTGDM